ncbi:hypothetical protein G0Q06_07255 [Puniceicoccales bacterium CK1056]|uniref:Uncharacterized protein n=1 Tax=Oceanipulchritudo coccoides TaxID=2706888 RepID=A0A6B2M3H7_9BACT|nr:hypothetical protein [Oceanipulchritudo coccoides]NDV62240.1 hypothetical protein [Oceanipulchritudo coccoides]
MIPARHIFHAPRTGWDRIHAWQEATKEPVFVWGIASGAEESRLFGSVKKTFAEWIEATGGDSAMSIYHDGFGSDAFGPLDPTSHKLLFLHHWFPRWERHFEWHLRCTGKVLVGDSWMPPILREKFGWIPERFIGVAPQPQLYSKEELVPRPEAAKPRTGIWLHGKSWRPYGNRLRAIVDRWPEAAGEVEIITEGGGPPRWARKPFIIWNSGMPFEFALHRIFTWDSTLLLNDFSLDSPWLLQALSIRCFPLVPDGESPAQMGPWLDDSAPKPYEWGDTADAVRLLQQWRSARESLLPEFGKWADSVLETHPPSEAFMDSWNTCKAQFVDQRVPKLRQRRPIASLYPVGWYERIQRLRAGF